MKSAGHPIVRLVTLTALAMVFCLTGLMFLRWLGSESNLPGSQHPWMRESNWRVLHVQPEQCNVQSLHDLIQNSEGWRIWIDTQLDPKQNWTLVCPPSQIFTIDRSLPLGPKLRDLLPELAGHEVIFNLRARDGMVASSFVELIHDWADHQTGVGIASPSQSLIRELRKQRPDWLFAADFSTWAKLRMYAGFGIETIADLWPDFFVASNDSEAQNYFFLAGGREIHRRHKVLVLQWDSDLPAPEPWRPYLSGVLTNRPKNFSPDTFFPEMGAK